MPHAWPGYKAKVDVVRSSLHFCILLVVKTERCKGLGIRQVISETQILNPHWSWFGVWNWDYLHCPPPFLSSSAWNLAYGIEELLSIVQVKKKHSWRRDEMPPTPSVQSSRRSWKQVARRCSRFLCLAVATSKLVILMIARRQQLDEMYFCHHCYLGKWSLIWGGWVWCLVSLEDLQNDSNLLYISSI